MRHDHIVQAWQAPEVAQAQLGLVRKELVNPLDVAPFRFFLETMQEMHETDLMPRKLLDVGCGVGHYSELLRRFYPEVEYTGIDFSESMIELAQAEFGNNGTFLATDLFDFDFTGFDTVLASSVADVTNEHMAYMNHIASRAEGTIIWHRVKASACPTYVELRPSYEKKLTYSVTYNQGTFVNLFAEFGFTHCLRVRWGRGDIGTYVIWREDDRA